MAGARETALNEARDEYRRLLYVAMTRAIERLIVCGVDGINKRPEGCWYDLACGALEEHCVLEQADRPVRMTITQADRPVRLFGPSGPYFRTEWSTWAGMLLPLVQP